MFQLTQKEKMLLQDQKSQEEICVIKYRKYSEQAQDPQLKQLFSTLSTEEQHHLDTVNTLLQGQEPNLSHAQQQQQQSNLSQPGPGSPNDKMLCSDLLSTEKYVSGTYDTSIFEAANPAVRQALQHIQKDEQQHGEKLFTYMQSHGMYQVQ
jgi:spore coat protein CotF